MSKRKLKKIVGHCFLFNKQKWEDFDPDFSGQFFSDKTHPQNMIVIIFMGDCTTSQMFRCLDWNWHLCLPIKIWNRQMLFKLLYSWKIATHLKLDFRIRFFFKYVKLLKLWWLGDNGHFSTRPPLGLMKLTWLILHFWI